MNLCTKTFVYVHKAPYLTEEPLPRRKTAVSNSHLTRGNLRCMEWKWHKATSRRKSGSSMLTWVTTCSWLGRKGKISWVRRLRSVALIKKSLTRNETRSDFELLAGCEWMVWKNFLSLVEVDHRFVRSSLKIQQKRAFVWTKTVIFFEKGIACVFLCLVWIFWARNRMRNSTSIIYFGMNSGRMCCETKENTLLCKLIN